MAGMDLMRLPFGFKPLQSGALDRSTALLGPIPSGTLLVSNPFRAGHWIVGNDTFASLLISAHRFKPLQSGALDRSSSCEGRGYDVNEFQTPSERGIGS